MLICIKVLLERTRTVYRRWWNRRVCAYLLLQELQNHSSLLDNPNRRLLDPTKKDTPHPGAKEKPQQDGRGSEITFRIKPCTYQRHSEGSNKPLCEPGGPTETEPDLPLSVCVSPVEVWVSSGLSHLQGLWMQQTWLWHKLSWRRLPLTAP